MVCDNYYSNWHHDCSVHNGDNFISYIEGRKHVSTLPELKKEDNKVVAKHIYHWEIDRKRFMEASIPVVGYFLQKKELFKKPFIAIAAQDYKDFLWTAFVSVNCGRVGNIEKDTKCGHFLFDPTGRHPCDPPPRCQFFLKLAHWILVDSKGPSVRPKSRKNEATLPWKDSVVAPWFTNVYEFYKRFTQQRLNFGCVITNKDNEKCDVKDGCFMQLSLPPNYMF